MHKTLAASLLVLLSSAQLASADPANTDPANFSNREGQIEFSSPSGNIGCIYTPKGGTRWYQPAGGGAEIACDIVEPKYLRVELNEKGKPRKITNVGDPSCCGVENVLPYGAAWHGGPFTCTSSQTGMACKRQDGIGFTISKAGITLK